MWNEEGEGTTAHAAFDGGEFFDVAAPAFETPESGGAQVVNYYFPVEIVFEGGAGDDLHEKIQRQIFAHLTNALERMT
jgi:hypothetical protein